MIARYIAVFLYAAMVITVGIKGSRKTKSFDDFALGGGKVGPWMTAFSYGTAYFSAVLFIGFAGKIGWAFGLSGLWIALSNTIIGVFGVWFLLGNKIKQEATSYNVHTMPELLEARYKSPFMKIFTSAAIFIFFIPYTAAVFMGLSYLFEFTFNMPYTYVLLFMGIFTGIYLVLGGYKSMAMIDVIFGMIMTVGVVILLVSTIQKGGGLPNIITALKAINPKLTAPVGPPGIIPLLSLIMLTSIAPFAMPQLLQKFYAIKDERSVKIGMFASSIFALLVAGIAYFTGALTRVFLSPESNPAAFNNGKPIFDALMPEMLLTVVPSVLTVVILLLILAASMSTLASLVLISSTSITKDIYKGFINKNANDKQLTSLVRVGSIFFILLSMILAFLKPAVIVTILSISWGAIASVFLGPFIWGIFNKKVTRFGAIAGSVGGLGICLILFVVWGARMVPQAGSVGMIASLVLVPVFSLFGKK
ncbi:MAG: sodium:solute symporter [Candidatus Cloacimonetes bacterium]|jgi:SSS family solute:Na+ symporter/sodium/proline symporter|nr:sodium:solute symporter [Candidatus Cloacimonadota bacterium]MBT4576700.1 sodium:solute symporter [Candidatus Cloacimonadota bacterium]